jgi:hypothetical protein
MEIIEYLRIARSRKWVLLGVPVLAAAATSGIILSAPPTYSATATISPAALVGGAQGNQYNGSQAVSQYVAAFQATASGPAVRRAVSSATKIPTSEIADGTDVQQVGASSAMTIMYTDTNAKNVSAALKALTQETLNAMFGSQVDLAQGQVDTATAEITSSEDAILAWEKTSGMVDPDRMYQSKIDQINSMTAQQLTLAANGNKAGAAAAAATLATTRASLPAFGPLLAQYHALTARQAAAHAALATALQSLQQAKAQLGAADPSRVTFIGAEAPDSRTSTLVTTVLPVLGASVFAAIAIVAMLELLSRNRGVSEPSPRVEQAGKRPGVQTTDSFPEIDHDGADDPLAGQLSNGKSRQPSNNRK